MDSKRLLKILGTLIKTSFLNVLQYRIQFLSAFFSSLLEIVLYIIFVESIFANVSSISGWTNKEIILLYGISTVAISIIRCFITPNLNYLAGVVRSGELDFILIKPIDSQFFVSLKNTNFFSLSQFIQGVLIICFTGIKTNMANVILCIWVVIAGTIIVYSFWFSILMIVFKVIKIDNAVFAIDIFFSFAKYPVTAYPHILRVILTYVIPLVFIAFVPAQALLGKADTYFILLGSALAVALLALSRLLWKFAVRHYSSASS